MPESFLVDTGLVVVHGPDATSFLQNLLSQDLDPITPGSGGEALLLQPQGKLVAPLFVLRVSESEWWLVCDAGFGGIVKEGLQRFKIRVKADIEDRSAESARLAVRGVDPGAVAGPLGVTIGASRGSHASWRDALVVRGMWAAEPDGIDVVGARALVVAAAATADLTARGEEAYDVARIAAGVPRLGRDLDDKTIPQEAFLEQHAVSFTKGCFLGQELVCRIDTRGHVNKYLRRVVSDEPLAAGADILVAEKVVGHLTSSAGQTALAMVRREVEPPASVTVRTGKSGTVAARIEAL